MYKRHSNSIERISDGAWIPFDLGNRDYKEFLEWEAKGNVAEVVVPAPVVVKPSIEDRLAALEAKQPK